MWSQIDENQVFRFTPSKTENTTGKEVAIDFTVCPMIMEELARIPTDQRKGPLIVNPVTGKPYRPDYFQKLWRYARDAQGVLRRSGIAICGPEESQRAELPMHRLTI